MDFEFSEQHKLLRSAIRDVTRRGLEPLLAEHPKDRPLPKGAVLRAMKLVEPLGMLGARVAVADGGTGLDHVSLGILLEETPPVLSLAIMSSEATATRIHMGGSEALKRQFLPGMLAGEKIGGSATSEPGVGSDPRGVETRAVLDGDGYVVNGTKLWITNGSIADLLMVVVSLGRDPEDRNVLGRLVVEKDVSPFEARDVDTLGLKQGHLCEVYFSNCRVPRGNLIGEPGDAHAVMTRTWHTHRVANTLWGLHVAQRAFDASVSYAKERHQFGRRIGSFQLVQNLLVEMATLLEVTRLLSYKALWLLDQGAWASRETSMAKWFGADACLKVTSMAIEVHGALGLACDMPLEQYFRDARMFTFPDGTAEINKLIVGREILGMRAFT